MANRDVVEHAAGLDLGASLLEFSRPRPGGARGEPFADLVIDVLQLGEKWVAVVGKHVNCVPERQVSSLAQGRRRLGVARRGIDPVPRRGRVNEIERLAWREGPLLE